MTVTPATFELDPATVTLQVLKVSPQMARHWLDDHLYAGQRPLSSATVEFLAECMRRGEWKPSDVEFRSLGDEKHLINGQHTLNAIIKVGTPQWVVLKDFPAPTEAQVGLDYSRTDRGRGRNLAAVFRAQGLPDELRLAPYDLAALSGATAAIARDFGVHQGGTYAGKSVDRRVVLVREWAAEARSYVATIAGTTNIMGKRLRLNAVMSVALVTLRHSPEQAHGFWRAVALNDGLRRGQPAHTLVEHLLETGKESRPNEGILERAVARAWNAHREGRPLGYIRATDPSKPILIGGSPWNGTR